MTSLGKSGNCGEVTQSPYGGHKRAAHGPAPHRPQHLSPSHDPLQRTLLCRADEDEEIIVKAMSDYWVVGKKSDQRELYVILNQKNANLIEVNGR